MEMSGLSVQGNVRTPQMMYPFSRVVVCSSGSALVSINEVNLRRARLVLGWVTVSGFNSRCGTFISVCDQPPKSTQPGHPFVGRRNECQPKGGDALRPASRLKQVWFVCGWQVKLCGPMHRSRI